MSKPTPFKIAVSDDLLSFIQQRVATARIPPGLEFPPSEAWSDGIPPTTVNQIREYWEKKYDWRTVEARINNHLKMFTIPISEAGEDLTIHFVHHRSDREGAIPLLFQHGWPGSFLEVEKIIDSLTSPPDPSQQAYHVVAPSLPGFAFSSCPKKDDFMVKNMAAVDNKLMHALGYSKYMAQGGDWGSIVIRHIGLMYPDSCFAIHVNMLFSGPPSIWRNPLTLAYFMFWAMWQDKSKDGSLLGRIMWWMREESGYLEIQGTKPQTLSYGLVDSPIGMVAWLRDKMEPLIDTDFSWSEEQTITWAMMYIIPGHSGHAQIYKNTKGKKMEVQKSMLSNPISAKVDFGASLFPKGKWWAACSVALNIVYWQEHDKGGHFAATESPDMLVQDIREFTKKIRPGHLTNLVKSGKLKV
ncbi:related to hydrolases or acyltransferases (alpha/beta hydrolase superfamily) [Phialocephala subalpina]|uniref:Related to hydrolases or acyltransferases (Alpha/beta hydrolase superfamily) n=1 Tax=Phialocephala subalpina TaxID=576137 RepID=A0A1L7X690_9HELO|nr:related to hydrolases or acyltransferases (alpha/beta hydrolase superfamily) [Phialocephala subalpina]